MRSMRALPFLLVLAACALPQSQSGPGEYEQAIAGRTAGASEACAPAETQQAIRVLDARTLAVESGRTLWINRPEDCPGLEPSSRLIVEVYNSQYCEGDRFRVLPLGTSIPGPFCRFGRFVPYRKDR